MELAVAWRRSMGLEWPGAGPDESLKIRTVPRDALVSRRGAGTLKLPLGLVAGAQVVAARWVPDSVCRVGGPDGQALPSGHIDLDVVDDSLSRRPAGLWRRWASLRVSASGVVVLVLIGGLIGAVFGRAWAQWEQRRSESARVSLFVAVADLSSVAVSNGRVSIEGSVAVANGGPLPVEVSGPGGGDFLVWGQQRIAAVTAARFPVTVYVTCSAGIEQQPLLLALVVVTADGVRRAVEMKVDLVGRWQEMVAQDCQLPR
ncbi:hypothetical protein [Dactylosporangium sp. CA-139066]|uniref:hypothetical protein n=1 Tax=Dactylosporangium sp. CA-139066 TaxID=3239930 RepID=UPI003D950A80